MQNNIRTGLFPVVAAVDLTGMEDRIVEMINDSGVAKVQLPSSNSSRPLYLLTEGGAAGSDVLAQPLGGESNFRVVAKGTGNPGDVLCLADGEDTAADKGKVRALPSAAGTYRAIAVCEETFADGGLGLARANGPEVITIT